MLIDLAIEKLQQRFLYERYIASLFLAKPVVICIMLEGICHLYELDGNHLKKIRQSDQVDVTVTAMEEELLLFLEGTVPLSSLVKQGRVAVEGKYRDILRLESAIYCALDKEALVQK